MNVKDVGTAIRQLNQNPSEAEIEQLVAAADPEHIGLISFGVFLNMLCKVLKDPIEEEKMLIAHFKCLFLLLIILLMHKHNRDVGRSGPGKPCRWSGEEPENFKPKTSMENFNQIFTSYRCFFAQIWEKI